MGYRGITNGCGACGGFWSWFKPPHHNFFHKECDRHDELYELGGSQLDRHIADIRLMYEMKDWVNVYFENRKPISRYWYLFLCNCYYLAVRIFGRKSFNFANK